MEQYEAIRQTLIRRRDELWARLDKIKSDVTRSAGPLSPDFAEQAVQRENDEVLDALGVAAGEELVRIREALGRIESEDYGVCTECGELIPVERLAVLPYSEFCIACAEKLDQR